MIMLAWGSFIFLLVQLAPANSIAFDDSVGYGRQFDGIGGLSGGGVSYVITR